MNQHKPALKTTKKATFLAHIKIIHYLCTAKEYKQKTIKIIFAYETLVCS